MHDHRKPGCAPGARPTFGELRRLECPAGHVAGEWWRPSSTRPFTPLGDHAPAAVHVGDRCAVCGAQLADVRTLLDPDPEVR